MKLNLNMHGEKKNVRGSVRQALGRAIERTKRDIVKDTSPKPHATSVEASILHSNKTFDRIYSIERAAY